MTLVILMKNKELEDNKLMDLIQTQPMQMMMILAETQWTMRKMEN
jgi:hypothetical protein